MAVTGGVLEGSSSAVVAIMTLPGAGGMIQIASMVTAVAVAEAVAVATMGSITIVVDMITVGVIRRGGAITIAKTVNLRYSLDL